MLQTRREQLEVEKAGRQGGGAGEESGQGARGEADIPGDFLDPILMTVMQVGRSSLPTGPAGVQAHGCCVQVGAKGAPPAEEGPACLWCWLRGHATFATRPPISAVALQCIASWT